MSLTRERFEALAQAHGGDLRRWPAAEREAAAALCAADPDFTGAMLAQAAALDAALDDWRPLAVGAGLRARVFAEAPRERRRQGVGGWLLRAGLGASLAAACAAGVATGAQISDAARGPPVVDAMATALTGYDGVGAESETTEGAV